LVSIVKYNNSNENVDIKFSAQNYEWVHSNKNVGIKISAQNYEWVHSNKNVGIKISTHDAFLEESSSGTLEIERLESHII
jgi:hypothetical protein